MLKNPSVIKFCLYGVIIAWILALGVGYLFAQLDLAGPGLDPAGYSLFVNYISDLGSLNFTPLPKFLDDGLISSIVECETQSIELYDAILNGDYDKIDELMK